MSSRRATRAPFAGQGASAGLSATDAGEQLELGPSMLLVDGFPRNMNNVEEYDKRVRVTAPPRPAARAMANGSVCSA